MRNQNATIYHRRKNRYPVRTHRRLLLSLLDDRNRRTTYAHKERETFPVLSSILQFIEVQWLQHHLELQNSLIYLEQRN